MGLSQAQPIKLPPQMAASTLPAKAADLTRPTPPTSAAPDRSNARIEDHGHRKDNRDGACQRTRSGNDPLRQRLGTSSLRRRACGDAASFHEGALVTITGCLETDDETFRLNDTEGSDAPKSRSWKTGFLKKRPATIAVVDANGVGLPAHVGQRVALTGLLVDRDMRVRSLRRINTRVIK